MENVRKVSICNGKDGAYTVAEVLQASREVCNVVITMPNSHQISVSDDRERQEKKLEKLARKRQNRRRK